MAAFGAAGQPAALGVAAALWSGRIAVEAGLAADAGRRMPASDWPLAVIRDVAAAALFWAGLAGRQTRWRGRLLSVGRRTLLRPVEKAPVERELRTQPA